MKSLFAILFVFSTLPLSSAFARSITIEVSNELTFQSIRSYEDGMTFVTRPKMYDYYLGSENPTEADVNAIVVCKKLGMRYFDKTTFQFLDKKKHRTVTYVVSPDVQVATPSFGDRDYGLDIVICDR